MAGRFPPAFLDELRARADIVAVVSRRVQLTPRGGRYWGLCPFHGEKTPSFSVNPQKQMYYCFGCHAGGSVITFVMEMEHLEFREAVEQLAEETHLQLPQMIEPREGGMSRSEKERLQEANRACARFYHAQLWRPENAPMLSYLHGRGLDDRIIRIFGLGSTPAASDGATRAMEEAGFTDGELVAAGISVRRDGRLQDMFRSRVIFPIIDARGRVLGFGGRTLGDAKPKYLNTGDTPIFNKRLGVYAANLLAKQRGLTRVVLTEGYMDVIALTQAGLSGVCATLGTALTVEQARLLKRYAPEIWVSYDGDAAGQHAILRALDIFQEEDVPVRVLDFPDGMDPDEYVRKYGPAGLETLAPLDAVTYRMRREAEKHDLSTQEGRTQYAKACAQWLARVREPVELENYVQRLMIETGFPREVLLAQIGRSELLGEQKQTAYARRAAPSQPAGDEDRSVTAVEETLLRLLADGSAADGSITEADFITERNRGVAKRLMEGSTPALLLEETGDDAERSRLAAVFAKEDTGEAENRLRLVQDCLAALNRRKIDLEIAALRERMTSAETAEKRALLERIQELSLRKAALTTRKDG